MMINPNQKIQLEWTVDEMFQKVESDSYWLELVDVSFITNLVHI